MHKGYTCMRLHDCEGAMLDQDVRTWRIGMRRHGRSAHVSKSYNVKRKSCNTLVTLPLPTLDPSLELHSSNLDFAV